MGSVYSLMNVVAPQLPSELSLRTHIPLITRLVYRRTHNGALRPEEVVTLTRQTTSRSRDGTLYSPSRSFGCCRYGSYL